MERVDLNERVQLKKEKELFFIMNEELNRRMCELLRETENLAKEMEAVKKENEYFYILRGQFMRDEDEELKKKVQVEDMEEKEQGNVELEVQSYGMAERNLLDEAPISPPVYIRRTKRVLKPSYYMVSPFLSLSSINTTPNVVRRLEEAVNFPTSLIPFHLQMDPFRKLSTDELKEPCLQTSMPTLRVYRDSKSALKRAKLVSIMNNVIAIAKQRGKSHAKEICLLLKHGLVYVPVNHDNSHWFLIVLYPRQREIIIIDSLMSNALLKYKQMINLMTEEFLILFHATGDVTAHEGKTWTAKSMKSVPKQCNGFDCGIFMIFERVSSCISQHVGWMKSVEKELMKLSATTRAFKQYREMQKRGKPKKP
ncbi:uncharacterized protein LOC131226827 [Magnolia sinica]|uniref:uncharacterized protein LOC131226827 n=1 Tax=Magnolia sinica TaxID=86752 RepID=UPI00265B0FC0|nr:uncharacterized protein LOC131226827 [Magnolia sinica]